VSLDIQAARNVQKIAAEQLKARQAPEEVRLAVEILSIVLDELQSRDKMIGDLRETMTY
jgi:hypothetical protein